MITDLCSLILLFSFTYLVLIIPRTKNRQVDIIGLTICILAAGIIVMAVIIKRLTGSIFLQIILVVYLLEYDILLVIIIAGITYISDMCYLRYSVFWVPIALIYDFLLLAMLSLGYEVLLYEK